MWDEVPLGMRNSLDLTKPQWFLISESLINVEVPIRIHQSKLWSPTEVVDWNDRYCNSDSPDKQWGCRRDKEHEEVWCKANYKDSPEWKDEKWKEEIEETNLQDLKDIKE